MFSFEKETKSLSEELGISNPFSLNVSLECDSCDEEHKDERTVKNHIARAHGSIEGKEIIHWKLKEMDFEKGIHERKLKLVLALYKLKEKEDLERNTCNCRGYCRILHNKRNWKKSVSKELFSMFSPMMTSHSCEECGKIFDDCGDLKKHIESIHKEHF